MTTFSYLSYLTSIVLALSVTRLLTGFGKILQARGQLRLYWVQLFWGLDLFLYIALIWWILFRWANVTQWNFFLFLFLLLSPIVLFLMSVLLFPDPLEPDTDLKKFFYANQRWFFGLAALLTPLDAIDTLLKGWDHFAAQGIVYPVTVVLIFVLNVIAAFSPSERYHKIYVVFLLAYLLTFISVNLMTIA